MPDDISVGQSMLLPRKTLLGSGKGVNTIHCPAAHPYSYDAGASAEIPEITISENWLNNKPASIVYTFSNPTEKPWESGRVGMVCSKLPPNGTPSGNPTE